VSWAAPGVQLSSDEKVGESGEEVSYRGSGRIVFAMLAWPGYQATVDGRTVEIQQGPAGLLQLELPPSAPDGSTVRLSFTPPGYGLGIPLMIGGLVIALGFGLAWQILRYRRRRDGTPQPVDVAPR
jgi:uncharacterized membrane protein YfhO